MFTDGYDLSSIGLVLPLVLATFGVPHIDRACKAACWRARPWSAPRSAP